MAEREKSGLGQWVHTSLLQAQIAMMDFQAARYLIEGKVPPQAGNDHPTSTPMGVVATADGFINIGVGGDGQWRAFCKVIGRPELAAHADYAKGADRTRNRPQIKALIAPIFATRTSAEWLERLEAEGVPAGPIYRVDEVFADPQVQHLGIAVPLKDAERGDVRVVGQPIVMSRTPASVVSGVPEQGEHTQDILKEFGYSDTEIAQPARQKNCLRHHGSHVMDLNLKGKLALISGASRGIGRAVAEELGAEGCDLVLTSRTAADLDAVKAAVEKQNKVTVRTVAADLSDSATVSRLAKEFPAIDILINNAGAIPGGQLAEIDEARWRAAWDLKVFGTINMTRAFYPLMKARGGGVIINVIGNAALTATRNTSAARPPMPA